MIFIKNRLKKWKIGDFNRRYLYCLTFHVRIWNMIPNEACIRNLSFLAQRIKKWGPIVDKIADFGENEIKIAEFYRYGFGDSSIFSCLTCRIWISALILEMCFNIPSTDWFRSKNRPKNGKSAILAADFENFQFWCYILKFGHKSGLHAKFQVSSSMYMELPPPPLVLKFYCAIRRGT